MKKPSKAKSNIEAFLALPDEEKARIADEGDREFVYWDSKPLSAAERKAFAKLQRRLGRPRHGEGSKPISVTVEKALLRQADAFARREGLSRAQLVARGLRLAITKSRSHAA